MFLETLEDGVPRFTVVGAVRMAMPQDEEGLLLFGYDTWGEGRAAETFLEEAVAAPNHRRGTRFLLEDLDHQSVAKVGVLRFARGVVGLYSIATRPEMRGKGYGSVLVRAVMELLRLEEPETRFLLFSEVAPDMYERLGFRVLREEFQRFRPSVAMATGDTELTEFEAPYLDQYF
jgi:GNAT superfamily N-acetyltransferase